MTHTDPTTKQVNLSAAPASPRSSQRPVDGSQQLLPENYTFLQQEIHRGSGIVLDEDKHYLFEARLAPVLRSAGLDTLNDLCARLRTRLYPDLSQQVVEALTTNETLFFRDMAPFEALRTRLIPELLGKLDAHEQLRIWSAAASSGQEAYSIAMLLHELKIQNRCSEILATDISEQILAYARDAKYVQFEVNRGLPAVYLVKYFEREGLDWRLNSEIRNAVRFTRFDLRQPMAGLGTFHVIFCRNVLIYFDLDTKEKIIQQLYNALVPGGYLLLGGAESIAHLGDECERVSDNRTTIYRKK
jgi:chemotaxis protein methyltransferase CheR